MVHPLFLKTTGSNLTFVLFCCCFRGEKPSITYAFQRICPWMKPQKNCNVSFYFCFLVATVFLWGWGGIW